jgi:ribosome-binding ATPase YchF (GTP1/OBG family)
MYHRLGLISFFTVGEDEVKAWTIEKGTNARKAAGKIHSDIERGFIRAEVVDYGAFKELGSMSAVKEKGLFRLEGKEYIVKDGEIVHFRFNI